MLYEIQDIEKNSFTFLPIHSFIALREIYLDEEKTKHIMLGKNIKYITSNFHVMRSLKCLIQKIIL